MERRVIHVAVAIIYNEGRYLITRRRKDAHLPDLWEFPGGKQSPDETLECCLIREVQEELDVAIQIKGEFCRFEHDYADRRVVLHGYLCRILSGVPKPLASQELRWVLPEALLSYPFPEANLPFLKRLAGVALH